MPNIVVYDMFSNEIQNESVIAGSTFADCAMNLWPQGFHGYTLFIVKPDGMYATDEDAVNQLMGPNDTWQIRLVPQGPFLAAIPLTTWVLLGVSLAATYLLAPKVPNVQGGSQSYQWEDSDRPQFYSGQTNHIQPGRRVPDVFGEVRVFPDLISTPATEYKGNNQTIRELYIVSRGETTISEPKFHDEAYDDVPGTSIQVYTPGQKWPSDFPIMRTNAAVGSIELPASNEVINFGFTYVIKSNYIYVEQNDYWDEFRDTVGADFMMGGVHVDNRGPRKITSISSNGRYLYVTPAFSKNQNISAGSVNFIPLSYVSKNGNGNPRTYNISWQAVYNGNFNSDGDPNLKGIKYYATRQNAVSPYPYQGTLIDKNGWNDVDTSITNAYQDDFKNNSRYPGSGHPATAGFKWLKDIDASKPTGGYWFVQKESKQIIYNPDIPGSGYASAIFNVPGKSTHAWMDFEFPTGLYSQKSGEPPQTRSVKLRVHYRKQSSSGGFSRRDYTFTDRTRTPRRFTRKLAFPSSGKWEIYIERITNVVYETSTRVVVDAVSWIGLHGRQDTSELDDDRLNCTLVDVTLSSQSLSVAGQNRRFNVIAKRILYNYQSNKNQTTQKICDAIFHTLYNMGNVPRTDVDEDTLLDIQRDLEVQGEGDSQFNGIIDQTMTVEDQVSLIASAGRIMVYRRAGSFYFSRLKGGLPPVTLFNGRNKIEPENRSFSFSERNDPDAIILRYQNQDKNWTEDTYQYPANITAVNPEEQTVLGLTDRSSIIRMAKYLWNRKKFEKDTISLKVTEEGALLSPGDIIAVTDYLSEAPPVEGEVIKVSGTSFTFDSPITKGTYIAILRDQYGSVYKRSQVTIANTSVTQNIAAWSGVTMPIDSTSQVGLLYSFVTLSDADKDLFYVTRVVPEHEGSVQIEGVLYRNEVYSGDGVALYSAAAKAQLFDYVAGSKQEASPIIVDPEKTITGGQETT